MQELHTNQKIWNCNGREFDKVFNVNAKSVYLSAKYFVPKMKKLKRGVILNVASSRFITQGLN